MSNDPKSIAPQPIHGSFIEPTFEDLQYLKHVDPESYSAAYKALYDSWRDEISNFYLS